jgi:hypothetical protein
LLPVQALAQVPARAGQMSEFPVAGDPLVTALADSGGPVTFVEALRRPARPDWRAGRQVPMRHWEDERRQGGFGPARRFGQAARDAAVLAEPGLEDTARRITQRAGRPDLVVATLPEDRTTLARR